MTEAWLRARGIDVCAISGHPRGIGLRWGRDGLLDGFLCAGGMRLSVGDIHAVLVRFAAPPPPAAMASEDELYAARERDAIAAAFVGSLRCRVVNRIPIGGRPRLGWFRPAERRAAAAAGMSVPTTMVTSERAAAAEFFERSGRRVIAAHPSAATPNRVLQDEWGASEIGALSGSGAIRLTALPPGHGLRGYCVGETVHWCDDRRPAATDADERCSRFTRALGFDFAALDLVEDAEQVLHCTHVDALPDLEPAAPGVRDAVVGALAKLLAGDHATPPR